MPADLDAAFRDAWRTARRMRWTRGMMRLTRSWSIGEDRRGGLLRELHPDWVPASPEDYEPDLDADAFRVQRTFVRPGQEEVRAHVQAADATARAARGRLIGIGVGRA